MESLNERFDIMENIIQEEEKYQKELEKTRKDFDRMTSRKRKYEDFMAKKRIEKERRDVDTMTRDSRRMEDELYRARRSKNLQVMERIMEEMATDLRKESVTNHAGRTSIDLTKILQECDNSQESEEEVEESEGEERFQCAQSTQPLSFVEEEISEDEDGYETPPSDPFGRNKRRRRV